MRPLSVVPIAVLAALMPAPGAAQARPTAAADSAWARQDWVEARRLYAAVLAARPEDSRAVYRLARLTDDPDSALALYRRYTVLEPSDPWGWMALGDARLARRDAAAAESAWDEAVRLAPSEPEVIEGRIRFESAAGRWWLRAGRPGRAARAFERALGMAGGPEPCASDQCRALRRRLAEARALAGPFLEPIGGYQRDSDGNRTSRFGLAATVAIADGTRLGVSGVRTSVGDGTLAIPVQEGHLLLAARPHHTTRLELSGGATRLDPGSFGTTWTTPSGSARLRWSAPEGGPRVELRAQRLPLGTTPELVQNEAVRTEGRGLVEMPAGPVRLRVEARRGSINALGEFNHRWGADGAVARPVRGGEVSLQYHVLGYEHGATVGYFAADRIETFEAGTYLELGDGSPWLVVIDAGAGTQRIRPFGEPAGDWGPALRVWAWISRSLGPGRELRLEADGSNAPGAATAVATSERWHQASVSLSLRWTP